MFDDPVVSYNRFGIGLICISVVFGAAYFLFAISLLGVLAILSLLSSVAVFWKAISITHSSIYSDWLDFLCDEGKTPDEVPFDLFATRRGIHEG